MLKAHHSKNHHILWVYYLIITLVFLQGAQLHLHLYGHHDGQHSTFNDNHHHQDQVHSAHQASDAEHSVDYVTTMHFDFDGFLNKLLFASIIISFLVISVVLVFPHKCVRTFWRRQKNTPLFYFRRAKTPPLRAPPL